MTGATNSNESMRFYAALKLTSPLHVSSGENWYVSDDGRLTRSMTEQTVSGTMTTRVFAGGQAYSVPFFPSNDVRGRLRRKAARYVLDALTARYGANTLDLPTYAGLVSGASDGNPEANPSAEEILRASQHVYMGVFGGGKRMLRSRLVTHDVMPVLRSTIDAGCVPEVFAPEALPHRFNHAGEHATREPIMYGTDLCDWRWFLRVDDTARMLRPEEIRGAVKDWAKSSVEYQLAISSEEETRRQERRDKVNAGERTTKTGLANMQRYMFVAPGTLMWLEMGWEPRNDAQTGLILCALRDLINEQKLGGWTRCGFGQVAFDEPGPTLARGDEPEIEQVFVPTSQHPYQVRLSDSAERYVEAMRVAFESLDMDEVRSFFLASKPPKKEKEKDKASNDDGGAPKGAKRPKAA